MTTPKVPNRLAKEKSTYLLQHAHNPVNWFLGRTRFMKSPRVTTNISPFLLNIVIY
ncbi:MULTISPECIES: DUF255 domain-containing protein [unclassified Paenibacillus]|uniref:DUF255 domain-containing protein n=1 Tax=unclassified Paenibacillus TaxID=185978 RepID=UPI00403FBBF0